VKLTLDHNCLIHLETGTVEGQQLREIIADPTHECFVVNIGASEMQRFGVRPDRYEEFESLLTRIGISDLPRLDPIAIFDVTFWDHGLFCDDKMEELSDAIEDALFANELHSATPREGLDSILGESG
jgi:hypothetical protein